jgi:hypothetical protein
LGEGFGIFIDWLRSIYNAFVLVAVKDIKVSAGGLRGDFARLIRAAVFMKINPTSASVTAFPEHVERVLRC